MQRDWPVFAKHFAGRDAEDKRVPDLSGRAGDSDFNRRSHIILYPQISADSRRFFTQGAKGALSSIEEGTARSTYTLPVFSNTVAASLCRGANTATERRGYSTYTLPVFSSSSRINRIRARSL